MFSFLLSLLSFVKFVLIQGRKEKNNFFLDLFSRKNKNIIEPLTVTKPVEANQNELSVLSARPNDQSPANIYPTLQLSTNESWLVPQKSSCSFNDNSESNNPNAVFRLPLAPSAPYFVEPVAHSLVRQSPLRFAAPVIPSLAQPPVSTLNGQLTSLSTNPNSTTVVSKSAKTTGRTKETMKEGDVECEICGQYCCEGAGMKTHKRIKLNIM